MDHSDVNTKVLIGSKLTDGIGAGAIPEVGKNAALESIHEIESLFSEDTKMVFLLAGLGGGTGTGATPVIAKAAKERGILTLAIVTMPFAFEGKRRKLQALEGLEQIKKSVDAYIIIDNDLLREVYGNLTLGEAFANADRLISEAVDTVMSLITLPSYINVDFKDVRTILKDAGLVKFSTSQFGTSDRALRAVESLFSKPFLSTEEIENARYVLLKICKCDGKETTMDEVTIITDAIQSKAGLKADLIWGTSSDDRLGDDIRVSMIASGFEYESNIEEVSQTVELLTKSLTTANKDSLSLYFLEEEYSPDEIVELLSFLSDLYRSEGGDELVIKGSDVLQFESILSIDLF